MSEIFNEYYRFYRRYPIYGIAANVLLGGFLVNIMSGYLPSIISMFRLLVYITVALILGLVFTGIHFLSLKNKTVTVPKTCTSPKTKYKGLIVSISTIKDEGNLINRINSARDSIKYKQETKELESLFEERGIGQTFRAIIYHLNSLDVCWLLYTEKSVNAVKVVDYFIDQFKPSIDKKHIPVKDPFNLKCSRKIVQDIYTNEIKKSNLKEEDVISDITGGTTPMSGAIIIECSLSADRDMQYTNQNENPELIDIERP
ncbi:hypothetical protein DU52_12935 [Methanosarcina mazei]|uniref:Uncharacterized protein n=2 Tax=Methanosarcina mazei TaxID=2209 RepID=A0A0F8FYS5_METMZ|nr:hypothetical protein [Methanosarcina mazei]AKB72573.1 hypothetical protein MSMAC_2683 [Methanosarcina mazei C16]KKG32033.1 hypothetical protein DU52_12935 [Methanosarcina mazei]